MPMGTYNGPDRLVFAIDLGTTMTAVSYAHLRKGSTPRFCMVTRWLGQEDAQGECKVPSVVRYDNRGDAVQFGAEAIENSSDFEGPLVKWFKLLLHPERLRQQNKITPPKLPPGVTVEKVYRDFIGYVFKHAQKFVQETSVDADEVTARTSLNYHVVLAIPNGWDAVQQGFLRKVLVDAGVFPYNFDARRLSFVTESEASVHFAIQYSNDIDQWLHQGTCFAVLDAGGSTVDTTIYRCLSEDPLQLEEVTASECVQAGSALLDEEAESLLRKKLKNSSAYCEHYVAAFVAEWEKKTKRRFDGNDQLITLGADRVRLNRTELSDIFQGPIAVIIKSVNEILSRAGVTCKAVVLVGGFAESQYLRKFIKSCLTVRGIKASLIDEATKKAAAEGACIWFAKQVVVARAARATYGVQVFGDYHPELHCERANLRFRSQEGRLCVPGLFSPLVVKNQVIHSNESASFQYFQLYDTKPSASQLGEFQGDLFCADGDKVPTWVRDVDGIAYDPALRRVCALKADLSGLRNSLKPMLNATGKQYWRVDFKVEVFFGQTALCASLVWDEFGVQKKGAVSIIPDAVLR
ncbi:hypothetical protein EXIGLDRAFT_722966 [Exidia glandulosa HHB12029]|uniref:Actin-like ATPase domain-containing protein n=1 Tax=Exidia glandulosa HHB12029 TaxID=1314781 RepID=A0A165F0T3_EXIGL|nr:hypothetical protein EXIGLDRAFT_722966 [Exidia glandulosa HHB12029]